MQLFQLPGMYEKVQQVQMWPETFAYYLQTSENSTLNVDK